MSKEKLVVGLIEWDGMYTPTVIMGKDDDSVRAAAVKRIMNAYGPERLLEGDGETMRAFPCLTSPDDVSSWLEEMREAMTVPWFSLLGEDDMDRTLVIL